VPAFPGSLSPAKRTSGPGERSGQRQNLRQRPVPQLDRSEQTGGRLEIGDLGKDPLGDEKRRDRVRLHVGDVRVGIAPGRSEVERADPGAAPFGLFNEGRPFDRDRPALAAALCRK